VVSVFFLMSAWNFNASTGVIAVALVGAISLVYYAFLRNRNLKSLDSTTYQPFRLTHKEDISHNTIKFRFALPSKDHSLGLPVGNHISLQFQDKDGNPVIRRYTPVTSDEEKGYFDLVIKVYPEGKMSQYLSKLKLGDTIDIKGPQGHLTYLGHGNFMIKRKGVETKQHVNKIGMIAGGTGITPMLQLIRAILRTPSDRTSISLLFANVSEADILLRKELDALAVEHKSQFHLYYTLDKAETDWKMGRGFVTADMIKGNLPAPSNDTVILMCGPPPMMKFMLNHMTALKYEEPNFFQY